MANTPDGPAGCSLRRAWAPHKANGRIAGVVAAAFTPCSEPGRIDRQGMTNLCAKVVELGCHGVLVAGSTGEAPLLDEEDRRIVVSAARDGVSRPTILYAGVGGGGLRQTLRYVKNAAADGADIVLVTAPLLLKWNQHELQGYVTAVADDSPIPVGIYHHKRMASSFEVETLAPLAEHPNVAAIKDTSADEQRMRELLAATRGTNTAIFQGTEPLILSSLKAGAHGCISALAGVAPELVRRLYDAFICNDQESAGKYQEHLSDLTKIFRLEEISESFSFFVYALRLIAVRRGWIESTHGLSTGLRSSTEFETQVLRMVESAGVL